MKPARSRLLWLLPAVLLCSSQAAAQSGEAWNDERVRELLTSARDVRASVTVDTTFRSYEGQALGYVYFFIDRPDSDERTLIKADQIALEVFWRAPNLTGQRIVGLRDEKVLPTNINYHLDHLTVVQDDFGDRIRLGEGDEVEEVVHPVAPQSDDVYDFLLADSLTIGYGNSANETRVYEVRVRPKVYEQPGFIGSVFLDRSTSAIVRMNFTFTPASYVDPYLDYIRISLDNALWDGKYWLPYRQEAELRRELPVLDFLAGSIIRGRFEIGRYDFNTELPNPQLLGRRVTSVPVSQREAYVFERGLFDDLDEQGLTASPTMEEIRAQARQVIQGRYLSGLGPMRLHVGSVSEAVRYNRAEGLFVGAGFTARAADDVQVRTSGGYAFARAEASGAVTVSGGPDPVVPEVGVYWNQIRDLGPTKTASNVTNTLAAVTGLNDYFDPYFARGIRLGFGTRAAGTPRVALRWERHESANDEVSDVPGQDHRPVRTIDEGILGAVDIVWPVSLPGEGSGTLTATGGRFETRTFGSLQADARWSLDGGDRGWSAEAHIAGGLVSSDAPAQYLFLLGGRETLPGHRYRDFVGDRFWMARAEATIPLRAPWVSLRLFGGTAATYLDDRSVPADWEASDSGGVRATLGAGLALGWDVLRVDLGRGLRDGKWEVIFSVVPHFRSWL